MENLIHLQKHAGLFSLQSAQEILPLVYHITEKAQSRVNELATQIEIKRRAGLGNTKDLENDIQDIVHQWQEKLNRLGLTTKGLWIVDFDNGEGFFCWKYPEKAIRYWHGYQDGFSGRVEIQ